MSKVPLEPDVPAPTKHYKRRTQPPAIDPTLAAQRLLSREETRTACVRPNLEPSLKALLSIAAHEADLTESDFVRLVLLKELCPQMHRLETRRIKAERKTAA